MLQTLRELIRFYSQKYHVPVELVNGSREIDLWNRQGLLVALPPATGQEMLLGDLVVCRDSRFGMHLGGEPMVHDGQVVARRGKNFLVLCFHPLNANALGLATRLVEQNLPGMARCLRHQQRDDLLESIAACVSDRKKELQGSIREDSYELERLSIQVMQLSRKLEGDRHLLRMFEKPADWIRHRAIHTYVDLMKLVPGVLAHVEFEDEVVVGRTHTITLTHDGRDYDFKPFEVVVNLRLGKVSITGGTECDGYIHPHVSAEGSNVCWGNIGPLVNRLAGELDLFPLFQLVHQFLSSYNPADPFQKLEKWDPDYEEPSDAEEPYCSFCDDYGHTVDECDECRWCEHCDRFVDHTEEDCPNRPKEESEEGHESELAAA